MVLSRCWTHSNVDFDVFSSQEGKKLVFSAQSDIHDRSQSLQMNAEPIRHKGHSLHRVIHLLGQND